MLSLLLTCCLLAKALAGLPEVLVHHEDGHLHFSMTDVPGVTTVHFNFQLGSEANSVLTVSGRAAKGEDGDWVLREKVALQPGDSVQYNAVAWGKTGKLHGPAIKWIHAPLMSLGPRRLRGAVMFRDDFNGGRLDRNDWDIEVSMYGGYNWEFQVYTPENYNVKTEGGNLWLTPTKTTDDPRWDNNYLYSGVMDTPQIWGQCTESGQFGCHREGQYGLLPPVMSGKIKSRPVLRYGTVETRARIPKGCWIWPAIWMLPKTYEYGGWPRSGEIDIMESRGNEQANGHGVNEVSSTLHWGNSTQYNQFNKTTGSRHGSDWSNDYHIWRLEWTHDYIATFVDDQQVLRVTPPSGGFSDLGDTPDIWASNDKMAPFDKEFYLMFNVAVGGTTGFFPDGWDYDCAPKPWANDSPQAAQDFWEARSTWEGSWQGDRVAMKVDWVEMRYL